MSDLVIYDTTLRDGTQAANFNLSTDDKIRITLKLDRLGIDYIEGGWPGANPVTTEYFNEIKKHDLKHAKLTAFGSTRNFKNRPEADPNLKALVEAGTSGITIFGKTWDVHVRDALRIGPEDNLAIIDDSLRFLRPRVEHLFYDAEHFFDGFKGDRDYALATIDRAIEAGADCIVLCDTNGGTLPMEVAEIIRALQDHLSAAGRTVDLGIHAHNDGESAVANSLIAVSMGACHVQGTMNGVGERCGNANLTSIMPALALKMAGQFAAAANLTSLTETSRYITELANMAHNPYQPYVGEAAFAHKGGIHVHAVRKNPRTYEHIEPEKVGNSRRILISDQSGRGNVLLKAKQFGIDLESDDPAVTGILGQLKDLERKGYQYEGAEASFELLMRKALGTCRDYFDLHGFRVISQKSEVATPSQDEATIRIEVKGEMVHTAALGEGPVNALDKALRKALTRFYPTLAEMELKDYKVRVLASEHGTGAQVRVLILSTDQQSEWGTVGVSHDIIEASWQALVDSITYKLMKDAV
ncbi:MAG: citramalate synthase [Desulfobulbales bacterium]|nr:citramalate synthase [Desulfobulbales bacterium]